jgi:hypothetical protein
MSKYILPASPHCAGSSNGMTILPSDLIFIDAVSDLIYHSFATIVFTAELERFVLITGVTLQTISLPLPIHHSLLFIIHTAGSVSV